MTDIADVNKLTRDYLLTCESLTDLVATRIYFQRLPHGVTLPAISYNAVGGVPDKYVPGIISPSYSFNLWASDIMDCYEVYRELYNNLQGIQNITVGDYSIMSADEEVPSQDLTDEKYPLMFRVITTFKIMFRAES